MHVIDAIKYLETSLQLIRSHRINLSTYQQTPQESPSEGQVDENRLLNNAETFAYLNMVYAHIALRDWVRALTVAQKLLNIPFIEDNLK